MKKLMLLICIIFLVVSAYAATTDNTFRAILKVTANEPIPVPSSSISTIYILYNGVPYTSVLAEIKVATPNVVAFKTACKTASIVLTTIPYKSPTITPTVTPTVIH